MLSAQYIRSLLPVATGLSAREIATHIPQALRDASLFSARTLYTSHLADTQQDLARALDASLSPAQVRGLIKLRLRRLGYAPSPAEKGSLADLSSDARTSLIVSTQMQRATSYAKWRADQDPAILDAFPGLELFRAGAPKIPRDWQERWNTARASLGAATSALQAPTREGPFYALKNDPIWTAISRFGTPFPPFDFGSSMRLRNIPRRRAIALGLPVNEPIAKTILRPRRDPLDGNVTSASAAGLDPELTRAWAASFGDRARVYTGRDGSPRVAVAPPPSAVQAVADAAASGADATAAFAFPSPAAKSAIESATGKPLRPDAPFQLSADEARHILARHPEITPETLTRLPQLLADPAATWRPSTPAEKGAWPADAVTFTAPDGTTAAFRLTSGKNDPRLTLITLYKNKKSPSGP